MYKRRNFILKKTQEHDGIKWYTIEVFYTEVGDWIRKFPTDQWHSYYVYNYFPYDIRQDLYTMILLRWS